jgi:cysteine protease ATG4
MNNIDLRRYKRMIQYFWDAEPKNEAGAGSQIWCLGREYVTEYPTGSSSNPNPNHDSHDSTAPTSNKDASPSNQEGEEDNADKDLGWPKAFLDDFESRIWMTYRSNFPPIAKSEDVNAAQAMTLTVRLRNQLTEGFTSDTGWGCMIRSGQSLLANALAISTLGRGV